MNVAGKRLAPAEVESVMITHPQVAEAARRCARHRQRRGGVGVWVSRSDDGTDAIDDETAEQVGAELAALVGRELGKPFTPSGVARERAAQDTIGPRSCGALSGPPPSASTLTCPVPKTPMPSARFAGSSRTRRHPGSLGSSSPYLHQISPSVDDADCVALPWPVRPWRSCAHGDACAGRPPRRHGCGSRS